MFRVEAHKRSSISSSLFIVMLGDLLNGKVTDISDILRFIFDIVLKLDSLHKLGSDLDVLTLDIEDKTSECK